MSDASLLAFGCAVTFTASAGVYVYLRECWEAEEPEKARGETRGGRAGKPSRRSVTPTVQRI